MFFLFFKSTTPQLSLAFSRAKKYLKMAVLSSFEIVSIRAVTPTHSQFTASNIQLEG
jgi:hypothetical protein